MERIPNNLAAVRKRRGLTAKRVAEMVGTHPGYISHLENGRHMPSLALARRIARALGASPDFLWPEDAGDGYDDHRG